MNLKPIVRITAVLVLGICLSSCFKNEKVSGTSTDSGNAITLTGTINQGEMPAARVQVTLYPVDFNPTMDVVPDSLRDTTGSDGKYLFKVSEYGRYNVQAVQLENQTMALIGDIPLLAPYVKVYAAPASLSTPGTLILYPEDIMFKAGSQLYIPGTGIFHALDSAHIKSGIFPLLQVPQARYASIRYSSSEIQHDVNILPKEVSIYAKKASTLGNNVDSVLFGTWLSTDPKGWSLDTAFIAETGIKVPGLQVYGDLAFTARNGLMTDWLGKVAVEYQLAKDTLYMEMVIGSSADGVIEKSKAEGFLKISKTVPDRYR